MIVRRKVRISKLRISVWDDRFIRFPAIESESSDVILERIEAWNDRLRSQATNFGTSSKAATVLLFSAHQVLTEVLDDPVNFDLTEDDPDSEGGGFWEDDLHLTEDMHDLLSERFLSSVFPIANSSMTGP